MRYIALIYNTESGGLSPGDPGWDDLMKRYGAFTAELQGSSAYVMGERLEDTDRATTLRSKDGKTIILDGPFAETREALGGFYIFECNDINEAAAWAAKIPSAESGSVEVRQLAGHDTGGTPRRGGISYMLLIYGRESEYLPRDDPRVVEGMANHRRLTAQAITDSAYLGGDGLYPTATAVTVRVRDGKVLRTDGPFAETREQLGGFYLVDYHDLDQTIEFGKQLLFGPSGAIEVRPLPPAD